MIVGRSKSTAILIGVLAGLSILIACDLFAAESGRRLTTVGPRAFQFASDGSYVVAGDNRLRFYSPTGDQVGSFGIKSNQILLTPGGEYVGLVTFADNQPSRVRPIRFEVYDPRGKRILRLNKPEFNSFVMAPNARAFVGIRGTKGLPSVKLFFLDSNGNIRDSLSLESYTGGRFTGDGKLFFCESGGSEISAYSAWGELQRTFGRATSWAVCYDGSMTALAGPDLIRVFKGQKITQRIDWPYADPIRVMELSHDGSRLAAMSSGRIAVFDVATGTVLQQVSSVVEDGVFRTIALDQEGARLAAGIEANGTLSSGKEERTGYLAVFENGENILNSDPLVYDHGSNRYPQVTFLNGGNTVAVATRAEMLSFEIH